jgi:hypothetical protein|tara:strand:+ start:414 stop:1142 length:729 start_codon:yes stop_codon:yes gene_type:complete
MTGLSDEGMVTTAGDTGTLVTDGSLVIGNTNTDNVVFNAEINSHITPNVADSFLLGSAAKPWKGLYFHDMLTRKSQTGPGFISVGFVDPGQGSFAITVPAASGTVALEGLLPSFLGFGKNGIQSAPVTNYELTTVNGSQNALGWRMPVDGFITNISCQFDVSNAVGNNIFQIALWKNGVEQASQYITLLTDLVNGDAGISHAYNPPLAFATNDTITLKMTLAKGTSSSLSVDDLACLLRILN